MEQDSTLPPLAQQVSLAPQVSLTPLASLEPIDVPVPLEIIFSMLTTRASRVLSKQLRHLSFSNHIRKVFDDELEVYIKTTYDIDILRDLDAAYWIEKEDFFGSDDAYECTHIIGYTNSKETVIVQDYKEGRFRNTEFDYFTTSRILRDLFQEEDNVVLRLTLGYSTIYSLITEDEKYAEYMEENEFVFKKELKEYIVRQIRILPVIYDSVPISCVYLWLYFNCLSCGLDVNIQYKFVESNPSSNKKKKIQAEIQRLQNMLELHIASM